MRLEPSLPLAIAPAEKPQPKRQLPAPRVMLIGGDAVLRSVEAQAIISAGCDCHSEESLAQAVGQTETARPDLILLDATAALEHERRGFPLLLRGLGAPVVLVADENTPTELLEHCWRAGADDCVLRPLRPRDIQARASVVRESRRPAPRPGEDAPALLLAGEDKGYRRALSELLQLNGYRVLDAEASAAVTEEPKLLLVCSPMPQLSLATLHRALKKTLAFDQLPALLIGDGSSAAEGPFANVTSLSRHDFPPERVVQRLNAQFFPIAKDLRAEERIPFFCVVEFREGGDGQQRAFSSAFSFDLSSGGIFLRTLLPARPRSAVELRLHLARSERVDVTGMVAWANRLESPTAYSYPVGMGVQFVGMVASRVRQLIDQGRQAQTPRAP